MKDIFDFSNELSDILQDNIYLRERVFELEKENKEHREYLDGLFKQQKNNIAGVLNKLLSDPT